MRARAPASSANLGPGFDVLALALARYVEVDVEPAPALEIETHGLGSELSADHSHLAARVVSEVLGHDRVRLVVRADIPVSRGLGSSAALAVAAAAAAGAEDPLLVAARVDGHAENAAASVLGGLVAATFVDGEPVARRLRLDERLCFAVVVPERQLETRQARAALPATVPLADAVGNLGRLGLLVAGLANADDLVPAAGDDRLHQEARTSLFPEAPALLSALREGGATVACWSGAGPSLLGICRNAEAAAGAAESAGRALARLGLRGDTSVIAADTVGLVLGDR